MRITQVLMIISVALLFTIACSESNSRPDTEEAYVEKIKNLEEMQNLVEATKAVEDFLEVYPNSEHAANFTSKLADLYIAAHNDFHKAIEVHKQVIEKFPGTKLHVRSQFMTGYIYANELNDLENAKIAYKKFLEVFPDDQLAASVEWELQNLGKDISDIPLFMEAKSKNKTSNGTSKK